MTPEEEAKLSEERAAAGFEKPGPLSGMLDVINEILGQTPGERPWWKREKEPEEAGLEAYQKLLKYAQSTKADDTIFDPETGTAVPNRERLKYLTDAYREVAGGTSAVVQEAQRGGYHPTEREKALSYHGAYLRSIESYLAPVLAEINPPPEKEVMEVKQPPAKEEPPQQVVSNKETRGGDQPVGQIAGHPEISTQDAVKETVVRVEVPQPQTPPPAVKPKDPVPVTGIATISSKEWNTAVGQIRAGKLPVAKTTSLGSGGNLPSGRLANAMQIVPSGSMLHPYSIKPVWNSKIKLHGSEIPETGRTHGCWCLHIHPGFLNGHPPAIRMWREDIPDGALIWANDYGKKTLGAGSHHSVLITDPYKPFIKCTNVIDTRAKVYPPAGCPGPINNGEVPLFMRARGAKKPDPLDFFDFITNVINSGDQEAVSMYLIRLLNGAAPAYVQRADSKDNLPEGNRLCYRADVVLQVDRPTVTQRLEPDDIGLLRYAGFDITFPQRDDYSARMFEVPLYTPPCPATYFDVIMGDYKEYPYDELVIGSIFFLSPTDEFRDDEAGMDGTWVPFVRHEVFWNLNYSSIQQLDVFTHDTSLEWFKGILSILAGGVAWLFAVSVVNPIEAAYDQILTAYNQTAVKGQFWTG